MNTQQISAIIRQIFAVAAIIAGIVTAPGVTSALPVAVSSILAVIGGIILAVEHFLSDPSTGTTPVKPITVTVTPAEKTP